MTDLISRAWVLAEYDRQHKGPPGGARKIIAEAPAVDAVPVVHGRWVYEHGDPAMMPCSVCGYQVFRYNNTHYCPHCGAKMSEQEKDVHINE